MTTPIQPDASQAQQAAQQPAQSQHTRSSTQPSAAQRAFVNAMNKGPEAPGAPTKVVKKYSVRSGKTYHTIRPLGATASLTAAIANLQLT